MHDDAYKFAGAGRDLVSGRFDDVAEQLAEEGHGFLAGQMRQRAENVRNPKLLKSIRDAVIPVGKAVKGTLKPGDPRIAEYMDESPVLSSLFTPLGLAAVISGGGYVAGADRAFKHNRVLGPLNEAQMRGETPMSDPFNTFVRRRQKVAGIGAPVGKVTGGAVDALSGLLKNFVTRQSNKPVGSKVLEELMAHGSDPKATALRDFDTGSIIDTAKQMFGQGADYTLQGDKLMRSADEFAPGKAALTGLGGLAAATGIAAVDEPLSYMAEKELFGVNTRTQAQDKYVQSLASTAGSNTATMINDLLGQALGGAVGAARNATMSFSQDAMFQRALDSDPLLREASDSELDMLRRAFASMVRFAPEVATDEFAVKNFLREAMMAANGPDYGTLGNLARVNRAMTGEK